MAAGLIGLIITLWFWNSRRRTVVTRQSAAGGYPNQTVRSEYRETRDDVPPPPPPGY